MRKKNRAWDIKPPIDSNGLPIKHGDILRFTNGRMSRPIEYPKDYIWLSVRTLQDVWNNGNRGRSVTIVKNINFVRSDILTK